MPIIKINLVEGRTIKQKEDLIKNITNVVSETISCDKSTVRIIVNEIKPEHLGIAGITMRQRKLNLK